MRRSGFALAVVLVAVMSAGLGPAAEAGRPSDPVALARAHLSERLTGQAAGQGASDFVVVDYRESLGGRHVHFQQTVDGLPLFGSFVTVSLAKQADAVTLELGQARPDILLAAAATGNVAGPDAVVIAGEGVGVQGALRGTASVEAISFAVTDTLAVRAWQVLLPALDPLGDWLVVVSEAGGQVLATQNLIAADHPGTGDVFDPNPVVSSGSTFPPPSDCDSAANATALAGELVNRTLLDVNAGQGQLIGPYVDLTAPGIVGGYKASGQADEASHVYNYSCDDDRFEEVMIYYHVDTVQRLIQSLGFTGASSIHDFPIPAHAHYFAACNAFYSVSDGGIHFGDGCKVDTLQVPVDWGEDADVIIHEYGHAIQDDQVAGVFFSTSEGTGLAEGFSDFLAAAVYGDPCMFEWPTALGTELFGFACLPSFKDPDFGPFRNLVNDLQYPDDVNADEHVTGLIWAGALWDLVLSFGGDEAARHKALTLVLQSNFYLNQTAQFADAAAALRQADIDLFGGADLDAIATALYGHRVPLDSDGDGCEDGAEILATAGDETSGGLRSPKDFWDYGDMPDPNPGVGQPERDGLIRIPDIVRVVERFGMDENETINRFTDPLSTPPKTGYHPAYDRGGQSGANIWNQAPANGTIRIPDIVNVVRQFGHDCA